ncbi:tudor and KH domain-containing protein isoform X1 [Astyanax mexicanus]|uniref:tudor and KH domain-containing protein isoform X1 n=2 Tax=Astyanax mexicanus TaxID=7994 RepID=UPI0020CB5934|nr:tudor and KH domain-containing protein isoform X1 [Astyanax mexicanus]
MNSGGVSKSHVILSYSPTALLSQWGQALGSAQLMSAVRDGPWKGLSSAKKVALAAGLSVGATVGYIVYRHIRSCSAECHKTEESRLSVPLDVYRSISRHQSTFLDLVNQQSGAQVNVLSDLEKPSSVCFLLQGTAEQILLAKCTLEKLATDCEVISDVIEVPQTAFGRIIGRGGETLKLISRTSGARVNCQRDRGQSMEEKGKVTISGTRQEVRRAKDLIMEKVQENETVRKRISQSSALRQKRKPPELELIHKLQGPDTDLTQTINSEDLLSPATDSRFLQTSVSNGFPSSGDQTAENSFKSDEEEILSPASPLEVSKFEIPSPDLSFQPGEHLEVYVSASENPQHFWIQIVGVRSLQLDKLTAEMSRFYSADTLQEHRVEAIVVGDIVAAPYRDHGTWNRARVLGILSSGLVDLYYVDFGDNGELPRDQLCSMRSDFLSLPFQAIECSLAGVCPLGEVWTEEALDDFDRMTFCAQWKPLLAKLCSYSHSEMSSWPNVKLYDNRQGKIVDLGEELIRLGHAVSHQDEGSELRDGDEPRSLQKMLDDMTGATSELSMSCISLSGSTPTWVRQHQTWSSAASLSSVEVERADVDQIPSVPDRFVPSTSSLIQSTPSQSLGELVSQVIGLSSSALSPVDPDPPGTGTKPVQNPLIYSDISSASASTSTASSSSPVNAVASALGSVTLCDDVFLETCDHRRVTASSSEPMGLESSLSTCSESVCYSTDGGSSSSTSNSSDGVRGVWYYLMSSKGSSMDSSLNTTMPASSITSSSSSYPSFSSSSATDCEDTTSVTSPSVVCLSSDFSETTDDAEMLLADAPEATESDQSLQKKYDCSVVCLSDSSICSSTGSDVLFVGSHKSTSKAFAEGNSKDSQAVDKKNELGHAENASEGTKEICEQAGVEERRRTEDESKLGKKSGDQPIKEVASISGSVDDVLEEEFA